MAAMGNCCCVAGCDNCCISRIEVDVGVPEPGEPGATLGTVAWNILPGDQPPSVEVAQNVNGTVRTVCRQIYSAPVFIECPGAYALAYNAKFLTNQRAVQFSYWQRSGFGAIGAYFWFEGEMLWRTYSYVRDLSLTVYRWTNLSKTVLSGVISQMVLYTPNTGSRRRQYNLNTCALTEDVNYTTVPDMLCGPRSECRPNLGPIDHAVGGIQYKEAVFGLTRDSGWVESNCTSLPTIDVGPQTIISAEYNPASTTNLCRVPTGSTYTLQGPTLGCTQGGTNFWFHNYTYSTPVAWFSRHALRVNNCV